jgi:hypothetical protein
MRRDEGKNQKHQNLFHAIQHSGVRCFQNWAIHDGLLDLHFTRIKFTSDRCPSEGFKRVFVHLN